MGNIKFYRIFFGLTLCISLLSSCALGVDDWPWDNPFGFCNPWPETGQIGAVWCRCGGGSTHIGNWPDIQPNSAGEFDWSRADSEYENQHKPENLIPVPILCYTPEWAMSGPDNNLHFPQNPFDYYRFVNAVAKRYHGKIPAYEVWNEPNGRGGFFRGGCDDLAKLMKLAFCAIKEVDPELKVIFPGLAGGDAPYTQRLYELGVQNYFDVMAFHPYQWGDTFSEGWQGEDYVRSIRGLMDQYGDNSKPIWLNEFGWSKDADTKARLLAVAMTFYHSLEYLGVEKMIWYTSKSWGDQYGLFDNDGKKTLAVDAFKTVVSHLLGKHYIGKISFEKARGFMFAAADAKLPVSIVLWSPDLDPVDIQLHLSTNDPVKVTQLDGTVTEVIPDNNKLALQAAAAPKFLTVPRNAILNSKERGPKIPVRAGLKVDPGFDRNVWAQTIVPEGTHRAYVIRGDTEIAVEVFNCSAQPKKGMISISSKPLNINVRKNYELEPFSSHVLKLPVTILPDVTFGVYPLTVSGTAGAKTIATYTDQIRLSRGRAIEFLGNSWIEAKYLKGSVGGAPSITFGNSLMYEFDLTTGREAVINALIGSQGKEWTLSISKDDKTYETLISDSNWPSWREVQISSAYLGNKITLKLEGNDCQLREFVLDLVE